MLFDFHHVFFIFFSSFLLGLFACLFCFVLFFLLFFFVNTRRSQPLGPDRTHPIPPPPPPGLSGSQGGYPRVHQKLSYPSLNLFIYL